MDLTADNLFSVGKLVGHLSYVLLVLSMMMRSMTWLRVIAVSAGLTSGAYGYFWLNDPVTVFWEAVFVLINLVQLLILAFENRKRLLQPRCLEQAARSPQSGFRRLQFVEQLSRELVLPSQDVTRSEYQAGIRVGFE